MWTSAYAWVGIGSSIGGSALESVLKSERPTVRRLAMVTLGKAAIGGEGNCASGPTDLLGGNSSMAGVG